MWPINLSVSASVSQSVSMLVGQSVSQPVSLIVVMKWMDFVPVIPETNEEPLMQAKRSHQLQ